MAADPIAWLAPNLLSWEPPEINLPEDAHPVARACQSTTAGWMAIPAFRTAVTGVLDATSSSRAFVRNLDPWYDAFHVVPGQILYLEPPDRVRLC